MLQWDNSAFLLGPCCGQLQCREVIGGAVDLLGDESKSGGDGATLVVELLYLGLGVAGLAAPLTFL